MQQGPIALPGFFIRFIGVAEVAGALGLILPGVFRIRQQLTPLAAAGLVLIMTGATVLTAIGMGILPALLPLVVGALAAAVAYGRRDGHIAAKGAAPSSLSAAAAPAPAARRARTRRAA